MADDDEDLCIICKKQKELVQEKLLTSKKCGHKFHRDCFDRAIAMNRLTALECAACKEKGLGLLISRVDLTEKSLDELECETDVEVRKRVMETYIFTQDDFETLREFQDYEQNVEDIIFTLVHGSNEEKEKAEKNMKEYSDENAQRIKQKNVKLKMEHDNQEQRIKEEADKRMTARQMLLDKKKESNILRKQANLERNAAALGETAGTGSGSGAVLSGHLARGMQGPAVMETDEISPATAAPVQTAPNRLAAFLGARELPTFSYPEAHGQGRPPETLRKARKAAGYNREDASRRDLYVLSKVMSWTTIQGE